MSMTYLSVSERERNREIERDGNEIRGKLA